MERNINLVEDAEQPKWREHSVDDTGCLFRLSEVAEKYSRREYFSIKYGGYCEIEGLSHNDDLK